jgi:hypothetical protein
MQDNHESAVYYLQQLLDRKPCQYTALVKLLGLLRRTGRLSEANKFISSAEAAVTGAANSTQSTADGLVSNTAKGMHRATAASGKTTVAGSVADGGLHYCKGLFSM